MKAPQGAREKSPSFALPLGGGAGGWRAGTRAAEIPTEAIHLSIGQEATAVGTCFALRLSDQLATTHRGHGHMLAKAPTSTG